MGWFLDRARELHPKRFFLETWRLMDEEAEAERAARAADGLGYDYRPIVALTMGAVFLTLQEYVGMPGDYVQLLGFLEGLEGDADGASWFADLRWSPFNALHQHAWWAGWRVLGFFLLPVVVVKVSGQRVRDQGLETKGFLEHLWIYVLCFGIVLVCVVVVSHFPEFQDTYPFYRRAGRSWGELLVWELLYAAQFFSLEFFFRGWWLRACKSAMGSHAIFAMLVPYVMIHYQKPMLETFAACIAGIVLGTLAMRTRSIWAGFLIHVSVALSMDVAALLQKDGLPSSWWPDL